MSDLTAIEKRKLERALGMGSGYVLNFLNRTFAEFFLDSFGVDIYDAKYEYGSGSKANRIRAFWDQESNYLVGRVLGLLFDEWEEFRGYGAPAQPPEVCLKIVRRLKESAPVPDIGAVAPILTTNRLKPWLVPSESQLRETNQRPVWIDFTLSLSSTSASCVRRGESTRRTRSRFTASSANT